nr:DUF421 domain-containing protein [uncultured Solibaculum sp.]
MFIYFIRTILLYIFVVLGLRLMGKRQIGELQPSELVVTLLISDIAAVPMQENGIPLISGLIPIFTLVALELIISALMLKSDKLRSLVSGKPVIIIREGKILQRQMKRVRFTIEDLMEDLRQMNIFRIEDVEYAIVETNGKLSILPKPDQMPTTAGMLKIPQPNDGLPMLIISDGQIHKSALAVCGLDEGWLDSILRKQKVQAKDVFLMTADKSRNHQIILKEPRA